MLSSDVVTILDKAFRKQEILGLGGALPDKHIKWDPYNGISLLHFLLLGSLFYMLVEAAGGML